MFEDLKKQVDKGVEYAFMNAEKLAQAAKDLAKENKLSKEEAKKLYDHLVAKSEEARKAVETELQHLVKNTLKKMDIPTQEDLKKLASRIDKLEKAGKSKVKSTVAGKKPETVKKSAKKSPAKSS